MTNSKVYIACAGSNGWQDWVSNIDPRCKQLFHGIWLAEADLEEAWIIWNKVNQEIGGRDIHIIGFSRGGGVGLALALIMPDEYEVTLELYAPKRSGNRKAIKRAGKSMAYAYRGDLVPYLPPWFRQVDITWRGSLGLPWKQHIRSEKAFVRRRHEISK